MTAILSLKLPQPAAGPAQVPQARHNQTLESWAGRVTAILQQAQDDATLTNAANDAAAAAAGVAVGQRYRNGSVLMVRVT